jgi:hypothetical protein
MPPDRPLGPGLAKAGRRVCCAPYTSTSAVHLPMASYFKVVGLTIEWVSQKLRDFGQWADKRFKNVIG